MARVAGVTDDPLGFIHRLDGGKLNSYNVVCRSPAVQFIYQVFLMLSTVQMQNGLRMLGFIPNFLRHLRYKRGADVLMCAAVRKPCEIFSYVNLKLLTCSLQA